jgi:MoaA/NifB/PqqE/SkfB family radical SAM enzyme
LEKCLKLADEIIQSGCWVVGFTGGEVLLHPHLFKIIAKLKSQGVIVYIVTNGLLLEKFAKKIIKYNVDYIIVSLDSKNPTEHDNWRNCKDLWQAALNGIQAVKDARTGKQPEIKTTTVVSRANYKNLAEIVTWLENIADVTSIQPITYESGCSPHAGDKENIHFFTKEDESDVRAWLEKFLKQFPQFDSKYFRLFPDFWFQNNNLKKMTCWSPLVKLTILPNGQSVLCTADSHFVPSSNESNVYENPLIDVWNCENFKHQREYLRYNRNKCLCYTQATAFNIYLNSFCFFRNLPKFNQMKKLQD